MPEEVIKVIREDDDSTCSVRASIGGVQGIGYYLVFRGEPAAIVATLRRLADALEIGPIIDKRIKGE